MPKARLKTLEKLFCCNYRVYPHIVRVPPLMCFGKSSSTVTPFNDIVMEVYNPWRNVHFDGERERINDVGYFLS